MSLTSTRNMPNGQTESNIEPRREQSSELQHRLTSSECLISLMFICICMYIYIYIYIIFDISYLVVF